VDLAGQAPKVGPAGRNLEGLIDRLDGEIEVSLVHVQPGDLGLGIGRLGVGLQRSLKDLQRFFVLPLFAK
jgi:hypothetical protein